jgi:hypothetical protein
LSAVQCIFLLQRTFCCSITSQNPREYLGCL